MTGDPLRIALDGVLSADATLKALLASSESIYHRDAPQGAHTPYVIFNQQAKTRQWAMGGGRIEWPLWLVKAVDRGEDSSRADEIHARILDLLTDADLEVEGFNHLYLKPETDVNYGQPDSGGLLHHVGCVYRIATEPA